MFSLLLFRNCKLLKTYLTTFSYHIITSNTTQLHKNLRKQSDNKAYFLNNFVMFLLFYY